MQAYPEGGIQNNKGWVSKMVASPHPSCVLTYSGLNPYPVLKVAFPVILSTTAYIEQASPVDSVLLPMEMRWKAGKALSNYLCVLTGFVLL